MTDDAGGYVRIVDFDPKSGVQDPARLDALAATMLCDTPEEPAFERLTQLVVDLLDAPVALVSLVDDRRQFFKAQIGLSGPAARDRETPLSHSFCQYVVASDERPLVIDDALRDPVLATNGAVADLGVIAYAGFPIHGRGGEPIGSLCAIDSEPRAWTDDELWRLDHLAGVVSDLIGFRTTVMTAGDRQTTIEQLVASQEVERTRIAAEVHDDTLQVLSALSMRLQLSARSVDGNAADELATIITDLTDATARIRRFVSDLRPDELERGDIATTIAEHLGSAVSAHPSVAHHVDDALVDAPDEPIKVTLFRIAQQAISNALTHAAPGSVDVSLTTAGDDTVMSVVDDGEGFDTQTVSTTGHFGLRIMRERAELVGGHLDVSSSPGEGTAVTARLPTRCT